MRAKWNLLRTANGSSNAADTGNVTSMGQVANDQTYAPGSNQADLHGTLHSTAFQLATVPEQPTTALSMTAPQSQVIAASEPDGCLTSATTSVQTDKPNGGTQISVDIDPGALSSDPSRKFTSLSNPSAVLFPSPVIHSISVTHGLVLPNRCIDMHAPFVANPLFVSQPLLGQSGQPKQAMPLDNHLPDRSDTISRPSDAVMTSTASSIDSRQQSLKGLLLSPGSLHRSSGFDFGVNEQTRNSFAAAAPVACNLPPNMLDPDFTIPESDSKKAKLHPGMYEPGLILTQPSIPEPLVASAAQHSIPHLMQASSRHASSQAVSRMPRMELHVSETQPASCSRKSTGAPVLAQQHDGATLTNHSQQHEPQTQHSTARATAESGQGSRAGSNTSRQLAQSTQYSRAGLNGNSSQYSTPVHRFRPQQHPHSHRKQQPEQWPESGETLSTAEQGLQEQPLSTSMQSLMAHQQLDHQLSRLTQEVPPSTTRQSPTAQQQLEDQPGRAEQGAKEGFHSNLVQSNTAQQQLEDQLSRTEQGSQRVYHSTPLQSQTAQEPESQLSRAKQGLAHSTPVQRHTAQQQLQDQLSCTEQGLQGVSHSIPQSLAVQQHPESQLSRGLQQLWNNMAHTPLAVPSTGLSQCHTSPELNTMAGATTPESQGATQHVAPSDFALSAVSSWMTPTASSLVGPLHAVHTTEDLCQECRSSDAMTSNAACSSHIQQATLVASTAVCSKHKEQNRKRASAAGATPASEATNVCEGGTSQLRTESCASRAGVSGEAMSKIARQCLNSIALPCPK